MGKMLAMFAKNFKTMKFKTRTNKFSQRPLKKDDSKDEKKKRTIIKLSN